MLWKVAFLNHFFLSPRDMFISDEIYNVLKSKLRVMDKIVLGLG